MGFGNGHGLIAHEPVLRIFAPSIDERRNSLCGCEQGLDGSQGSVVIAGFEQLAHRFELFVCLPESRPEGNRKNGNKGGGFFIIFPDLEDIRRPYAKMLAQNVGPWKK